jgi:seryl-tRNA synthetase
MKKMINEQEFRKLLDMDKTILVAGFIQLDERLKNLQANFDRLSAERNELLKKLTNVDLPKQMPQQQQTVQQFQKPMQPQLPRRVPEPVSIPEPISFKR